MKRALLLLLALFVVEHLPVQAQDDPWIAINSLLDQADTRRVLLLRFSVRGPCVGGLKRRRS